MIPEITIKISMAQDEIELPKGQSDVMVDDVSIPLPPEPVYEITGDENTFIPPPSDPDEVSIENNRNVFLPPDAGDSEEALFLLPPQEVQYEVTIDESSDIPPPPEVVEDDIEINVSDGPEPPPIEL